MVTDLEMARYKKEQARFQYLDFYESIDLETLRKLDRSILAIQKKEKMEVKP